MKWPGSITLIRHGQSLYNVSKELKEKDLDYQKFKQAYEADYQSAKTKALAKIMQTKYTLAVSDYKTPLTQEGIKQARLTGIALAKTIELPDVIFCSPYLRINQTLVALREGWSNLKGVPSINDDRIREQEHGLANLYNDWRIFHVFHPEQKIFQDMQGLYWYQFPQGESVSQVRDRIRSMVTTLIREWAEKNVWLITHHLTLLSVRANMERLSPEQFVHLDKNEKPVNCGITRYECNTGRGKDGKMELVFYNRTFF